MTPAAFELGLSDNLMSTFIQPAKLALVAYASHGLDCSAVVARTPGASCKIN